MSYIYAAIMKQTRLMMQFQEPYSYTLTRKVKKVALLLPLLNTL